MLSLYQSSYHLLNLLYVLLAVVVSALRASILSALAGLCPPYLLRFALEFSRALRASVRSFISIRQVAPHDLDFD